MEASDQSNDSKPASSGTKLPKLSKADSDLSQRGSKLKELLRNATPIACLPPSPSCSPPGDPSCTELPFSNINPEVPLDPPAISSELLLNLNPMKDALRLYQSFILRGPRHDHELLTAKDFPHALEDPLGFARGFALVIQTHKPGNSDLYQLLRVLVNEGHVRE